MDQIKDNVACVIIEPIITDYSQARLNWLQEVIRKAHVNGALVIFDEVITGFRWPKLSFSKESGIHPDIICLGKACASGLPLAIVGLADHVGEPGERCAWEYAPPARDWVPAYAEGDPELSYRRQPPQLEWFVSSTYAGELLSLAAFKRTCEMLTSDKFPLERLWADGQIFLDEFNSIWPMVQIEGYPTRGVFKGDLKAKALFWQEACKAGLLFGPSWFYGFQHIGMREQVIGTCKDILTRIQTGSVSLEGELPSSPFAERVRA
jgi:glutamate-1-semialdehyde aminotransferase